MKKQINPTIKAHLIRGAFYLLLLVAVCAIPFALAQRNTIKRANPASKSKMATKFAGASRSSGPAQATKLSGVHSKAASQSNAGSRFLPYDVRKAPSLPVRRSFSQRRVPFELRRRSCQTLKEEVGIVRSLLANIPLFTYMIDDGTAEDSVGLTAGGNLLVLNSFPVSGGNNTITSISIAFGTPLFPDPTLNGLPYTAVLWSDPNGDGSPTDAVVLAQANGVVSQAGTDTFITTAIPSTMVTTTNFFVGLLINHIAGQFPAAFDETAPTLPNRSWVSVGGDINNMSDAITIESAGLVGNWLIRADGQGGGTPTPTPTGTPGGNCGDYTFALGTATFVPGVDDLGLDCDDCGADVPLPFTVHLYDQDFTTVHVGSNGHATFGISNDGFGITCSPFGIAGTTYALGPFWGDQTVFAADGHGVFTTTTGSSPNRIFYIEWRSFYFGSPDPLNYEIALNENGAPPFQYIYNTITPAGAANDSELVVGVKKDDSNFNQFGCDPSGGQAPPVASGDALTATCVAGGGSPTPTPTGTPGGCQVTGSIDTGDPTQTDRLFRSGIPQTCPASYDMCHVW